MKNWPHRLAIWVILACVLASVIAFEQAPDAVAIVAGDPVPMAMFQQRVRLARWQIGQQLLQIVQQYGAGALTDTKSPYSGEYTLLNDSKKLGQQVLDSVITAKLIAHEAASRGIAVSDADVQQEIDALFGLGPVPAGTPAPSPTETAALQANRDNYLGEAGVIAQMTQADIYAYYAEQVLQTRLFATLTDSVPKQAEQIHVSHILVDAPDKANAVLTQLHGGAKFADVAKTSSIDTTTNAQGGDLGWTPRGVYEPEFDAAIWAAKVGEIVGPVKTKLGYHIILIAERAVRPLNDADYIRAKDSIYQAWLTTAHANSNIAIIANWFDYVPGDPTLAQMGLPAAK